MGNRNLSARHQREAWSDPPPLNSREAEIDETYVGGKEKNKHGDKKLRAGRGTIGKTIVVGMRDRRSGEVVAEVIADSKSETLQAFAEKHLRTKGVLYTDDAAAYRDEAFRWPGKHRAVRHGRRQYVDGNVHTNGIESFWAVIKRAHKGTFHKISTKHLQRYLNEFCARHNIRNKDTIDQMIECVRQMTGKCLTYKRLTKR